MAARHILAAALLAIPLVFHCSHAADDTALFGGTKAAEYLTGRFNPARHELFVRLTGEDVPTKGRTHYLRAEAAGALKKMYAAFRKAHPKEPFWLQSSTRSFNDQKVIWEGKWRGPRLASEKDPVKRALAILRYSSMPGTSRHHWGTDVDLNVLTNDYYESGEGVVLYRWLTENAGRYGFCRPYTSGRKGGYNEEKWHWSYSPLASIFLARWNELYEKEREAFTRAGLFAGSETAGELAPVYVNTVSGSCR